MAAERTGEIVSVARPDKTAGNEAAPGSASGTRETVKDRGAGPGTTVTPASPAIPKPATEPTVDFTPKPDPESSEERKTDPPSDVASKTDPPSDNGTPLLVEVTPTSEFTPEQITGMPTGKSTFLPDTIDPGSGLRDDTGSFSVTEEPQSCGDGNWPTVAGYDILGELGRGGMGVVYKARQRGLNRLVALKMVLAGAHASEHQLIRFRAEAEAVARLLHPNIVQIYEINEQDGLPFFSLEYVNGDPLDKKISGKAMPPRESAELVETLARTMYFAHEHGVIHRDLKPGNVLLTADGIPKITDFGLAKQLEESSSSQTRTGTVMGTPSYMSPEQARGEIRNVGPLADLYTLGAILYRLLTGRPPFVGATTMQTVSMVINDEPVPPSRFRPNVPHDLETICLKCLQKEPQKRYANCFELAEDLKRFQAGEPIQARPVGAAERLARWCKRNPGVAMLSGLVLALLLVVALGSSTAFLVIYQKKQEADQQRAIAEMNGEAEKQARLLADERKKEADANKQQAVTNGILAMQTLKDMTSKIQEQLQGRPDTQELRLALLRQAFDTLQRIADDKKNIPLGLVTARANMYMGQLFKEVGQADQALDRYVKAHDTIKQLADADPASDGMRFNLSSALTTMGDISLVRTNESAPAVKYYREGLRLRQEILDRPRSGEVPRFYLLENLEASHNRIGNALPDPAEAREHYRRGLALRQEWIKLFPKLSPAQQAEADKALGYSYLYLGGETLKLGEPQEALKYYEQCRVLRTKLAEKSPNDLELQRDLGFLYERLGNYYLFTGEPGRAKDNFTLALTKYRRLRELNLKDTTHTQWVARALYLLGVASLRLHETKQSEAGFAEALRLREELAKKDPANVTFQKDWLLSLARAGRLAEAEKLAARFRKDSAQDGGSLVWVARAYALCAAATNDTAERKRFADLAVEALRQAAAVKFPDLFLVEKEPDLDSIREGPEYKIALDQLRMALPAKNKVQ